MRSKFTAIAILGVTGFVVAIGLNAAKPPAPAAATPSTPADATAYVRTASPAEDSAPPATQSAPAAVTYTPPSETLNVAIEIIAQGGGKPVIIGKTNLPDGFQAIVSMKEGRRILGQANVTVRSGQFIAGPFSLDGQAYPRGTYTVSFDSPCNFLQPAKTQEVIGPEGAFLRGPFVWIDNTFISCGRLIAHQTVVEIG
jgi:hypothetical protein